MTIDAPAFVIVNPSFIEPEIILQYSQASGAFDLLAGGEPRAKIEEDALYVYIKTLALRTKMAAGTASYDELPGPSIVAQMISTPTYLQRCRAQYDHHDVRAAANWGFGAPEAYRLGMRQAHFQLTRDAELYGFNPQNGEGIINTPGATAVNMPPDSYGNTTIVTYDNGQLAFLFLNQIATIKTNTLQLGISKEFTICGPQRVLAKLEYNVVQVVQYQRTGGGTNSSAGVVKEVLMANGDKVIWSYDDTLIGKGTGGNDLVIFSMPEVTKPRSGSINTNEFASLSPGNPTCVTQYADMGAPREIVSPLAGGATDVVSEWRTSSGWGVRPQGLVLLSCQYQ